MADKEGGDGNDDQVADKEEVDSHTSNDNSSIGLAVKYDSMPMIDRDTGSALPAASMHNNIYYNYIASAYSCDYPSMPMDLPDMAIITGDYVSL